MTWVRERGSGDTDMDGQAKTSRFQGFTFPFSGRVIPECPPSSLPLVIQDSTQMPRCQRGLSHTFYTRVTALPGLSLQYSLHNGRATAGFAHCCTRNLEQCPHRADCRDTHLLDKMNNSQWQAPSGRRSNSSSNLSINRC